MERKWMTLDQIKAEYASNDYNPELLLQHLLHHVEASPASVLGGWVEWMQNIDSAMKEPIFQEARALMGTENYGQDVSLLQALRLVRRRMLAAAPTPPVSEERKDAERYRALKTGDFAVDQFVSASYGWKAIPTEELDQAIDAAMYGEVK